MRLRYKLEPRSPLTTPLMSDTLFGHFCWAVRYRDGEKVLNDFLARYDTAGPAPVLFSSAFLSDHLPRPTLPSPSRPRVREFVRDLFGTDKAHQLEGLSAVKKWSKIHTLPLSIWLDLKDQYSDLALYQAFYDNGTTDAPEGGIIDIAMSNRIDRITGTVPEEGGGGLFQREKTWFPPGTILDLYVEVNDPEWESGVDWFLTEFLPDYGFGADKSIGMGAFSIARDVDFDESLFSSDDHSAGMSLSFSAFPGMGDIPAFYRLKTKFGKLGGDYAASSPTGGDPRPFKKPILMYEPGVVFLTPSRLNDCPLLSGVHSDPAIRHFGIPFILPFNLSKEAHDAITG